MPSAHWLLAAALIGPVAWAAEPVRSTAPAYSAASIVNAASNLPGPLAPNALASLYGKDMAYSTRAITQDDIINGLLPTILLGTGVRVYLQGIPAVILYVSPTQINFIVPPTVKPGNYKLWISRDGVEGPHIDVTLADSAPGVFQIDPITIIATHADGALVSKDRPARPGQVVVLYAAGMGQTDPRTEESIVPRFPALIKQFSDFEVRLNGQAVDKKLVLYAGITPGFAGLYQVNVFLPADAPSDPELQLRIGPQTSQPGVRIPLQPETAASQAR